SAFPGASLTLAPASSCAVPLGQQCAAAGASGNTTLSVDALPAGQYVLIVDGGTAVAGQFSLSAALSTPIFAPDNDTCATAADLPSGDAVVSGDTRAAADDFTPACGDPGSAGDAVYHLAVTTPQEVLLQA